MTWLNPAALVLTVFAVPIVLLYVLKLRRPRHVVPSTLLWRRSLDDIQANTPWQRLRPNALLFLQLLIVLTVVAALARPAYSQMHSFTGDLVVIVDESPAMGATDVSPSRFGAALGEARLLASQLTGGNVMSVVGMAAQPHLVVDESADQGAIARGISSLQLGVTRPNFQSALSLAASLARNGEQTRVVVLTSRDSGIRDPQTSLPFSLELHRFGGRVRDLGIIDFRAARAGSNTEATLTVRNDGTSPAASDLDLYADGQLADVRPVSFAPGEQRTLFWTQLPGGITRLQARLAHADDVKYDKSSQIVLPSDGLRRVLVVTRGDYWLRAALALDRSFTISTVGPQGYVPGLAASYDLVIFDGFLPHVLPPTASLLIAPPSGKLGGFQFGPGRSGGSLSAAQLSADSSFSALLQYVDLSDVHVSSIRQVRLPAWMQPLIVSNRNRSPVVAAGDRGGARVALIGFSLQDSDWPLRISYPIVMHNLLAYLTPGISLSVSDLDAGQPLRLYAGSLVREIDITKPDGQVDRLRPPFGPFEDTAAPGFYSVRERELGAHSSTSFAVNLFGGRAAPIGGPSVSWFGATHTGGKHGVQVHVSLAWVLALAALGLLSAEWLLAWKR